MCANHNEVKCNYGVIFETEKLRLIGILSLQLTYKDSFSVVRLFFCCEILRKDEEVL